MAFFRPDTNIRISEFKELYNNTLSDIPFFTQLLHISKVIFANFWQNFTKIHVETTHFKADQ